MRAFEWGFAPPAIVLERDREVRIELRNDGEILHDFKIEQIEAEIIESISTGGLKADEGELFVGADSGGVGTLVFIPRQTGAYAFWCTIGDHRGRGMEGTVIIR